MEVHLEFGYQHLFSIKGNTFNTWTKGGPAGACYRVSDSSWMEETKNYTNWFEKQFYTAVKHLLDTDPVLLFLDGHHSHLGINLIQKAKSLGIYLLCLPPNTTHVLQPLDVGVFGPIKASWRSVVKEYNMRTRAANIKQDVFPSLICRLSSL